MIKGNPSHVETTADEEYQFTCVIDNGRVFRDGANVERINFRGGDVTFVKQTTLFPLYTILLTIY